MERRRCTAMSNWNNINIESTIKTDMFPNGYEASYFPAVTVQVYGNVANTGVLEFIFSPEDMQQCPLPKDFNDHSEFRNRNFVCTIPS
ncbi:unnamed protein product [Adineta steineri]|uniref:Uncharacterized protein n=1 Tax=Adineta steineri TaxID=433720 RepID=A0A819K092_9BILA|nr:unnamed protein product [Adineta steineri]CAF3936243.1 unnamed protein product [Adineta steineri]